MRKHSVRIALWHKENATGGESCKQDSIKNSACGLRQGLLQMLPACSSLREIRYHPVPPYFFASLCIEIRCLAPCQRRKTPV